jgi:hypothetical protein
LLAIDAEFFKRLGTGFRRPPAWMLLLLDQLLTVDLFRDRLELASDGRASGVRVSAAKCGIQAVS